jgi:hypothetical protein
MQVTVVVCWFGAMIVGAFAYGMFLGLTQKPEAAENPGFIVYPIMLAAAVAGQLVLFTIVKNLPSRVPPPLPGSSVRYQGGIQ